MDIDDTKKNEEIAVEDTELEKAQKQAQEYLDGWKRAQADFINYKKDEVKRSSELARYAGMGVITQVLDAMDDLYTAAKQINNPGLDQVIKKFEDILKKHDVEKIDTSGAFDPNLHEAVGGMEGDKLEEVRAGYTMDGRIIRPARVRIVK